MRWGAFTLGLYEKLEEHMMKYPKVRVMQLEMQLKYQKQKKAELQAVHDKKIDELIACQQENFRLYKLQDQIEQMKAKIQSVYIPAINKEALMKGQIHELYMKLGKTSDQAWEKTYKDIHEWESLSLHMSQPHVIENFIKV